MLRLGILASTKGTDMQAIIDAINSKKLNAVISVGISNKQDAYALERAKKYGIKAVFIDSKGKEREEFDKIFNKIFLVCNKHQAFTEEQWNDELAPLFRKLRELITTSYD